MAERNPYHVPAGSSEGGQFTSGQLKTIEGAARKAAGLPTDYDNPSKDLLNRTRPIYKEFTDGEVSKYIYKQMRGAEIKKGTAVPLTPSQKLSNLKKIKTELDIVREIDPEAYDWATRMSIPYVLDGGTGTMKWADVPDLVDVYRGDSSGLPLAKMTNVTFNKNVAASFGKVTHYKISKWDIGYANYASSFDEGEVFIFDTKQLTKVD